MLAELPADLFSHHASPLEFYIFVAVDERGEDVMPDDIYLSSMQRKTAKKEERRPKCAAPRDLGDEQNQKATYYCSYLGHQNEVTFVGGISERCPTNTTHHPPTFQCEAVRVSAKFLQSGWVGIGRRVWVTKQKNITPE